MKKKLLSLALALAVCLGLAVPTFADEEPPMSTEEGLRNMEVVFDFPIGIPEDNFSVYNTWIYKDWADDENPFEVEPSVKVENPGYIVCKSDTKITVSHTGTVDDGSYIGIDLLAYEKQPDGEYEWTSFPNSCYLTNNGQFLLNCEDPEPSGGLVQVKAGQSVTFTLPADWYDDVIFMLQPTIYYPEYNYHYYRYYYVKPDDAVYNAIAAGGTTPAEFTPIVTATPTTFDVGTTKVKVTLKSTNVSFSSSLDPSMFIVDMGTTRLSLISVEPVQQLDEGRIWNDAVLTFANFTATNGAAAGELKITAKGSAFISLNAAIEDAAPVTITIGTSSGGDDTSNIPTPPPVFPDLPYIPSTPSTSTGGSNTTTNPSTSTTATPTPAPTTDTVTNPDGSTTTVNPDGTVTTTATDAAGNKTTTTESSNGSTVTTIESRDGGVSTTTVSAGGQVTAAVSVPAAAVSAAQASGQAVALPMPEVPLTANTASAPVITVTTGSSQPVKVEIPVERTTPGTVAVIVNADGTEEVVKTSLATANGVTLTIASGATVKIVDNSKSFADTATHWAGDAITFATAHELFNGTGADSFTPEGTMTRGMMVTVLARYDGVDTTAGATWYEKGVDWAAANNISSGTDLDAPVSREQLATMLYRYAAASGLNTAASGSLNRFPDVGSVSDYAVDAMAWAVGTGLIGGTDQGELNPSGSATRAEVATILMRFCENVAR